MKAREANFDGLVGLTHHYAGLLFDDEASAKHRFQVSGLRLATRQGLLKMEALADAGFPQAAIPLREWPCIPILCQLGFNSSDEQALEKVPRQALRWLSNASSASSMRAANAAMVCSSVDSLDRKVYLTVANLNNKLHRSPEVPIIEALLRAIFRDENSFAVHGALSQVVLFGDEGVANHNRLGGDYGSSGVQLSAYDYEEGNTSQPKHYPARQSCETSEAVVRLDQVNPHQRIFAQ